jgi:hypothetical protein
MGDDDVDGGRCRPSMKRKHRRPLALAYAGDASAAGIMRLLVLTVVLLPLGARGLTLVDRKPFTKRTLPTNPPPVHASPHIRKDLSTFEMLDIYPRNMTSSEMITVSSVGAILSFGLVYSLAMNGEMIRGEAAVVENLEIVTGNVLDAMLPLTATDLLSVTLGEALAGAIGAAATFVVSSTWNRKKTVQSTPGKSVVADGDFFLASAAAFPLIQALGVPPVVSSIMTTLFASVPYELVKVGSRRRQQRLMEDNLLQQLLDEQRKRDDSGMFRFVPRPLLGSASATKAVSLETLVPVGEASDNKLDFVEVFSDLVRWLEYGILMTDFGGRLSLLPGLESAVYGTLATLSSQVYADVLYAVFGFGGEQKRESVRSRTPSEWSALYLSQTLYAAT